jgi:hypothetical protein
LTFQKERKEQMAKGLDRSHNLLKYKKNGDGNISKEVVVSE